MRTLLLPVCAAVLILAACASRPITVEVSADTLAAAADATAGARSSRFVMDLTSGFSGVGDYRFRVEGLGLLDGSELQATLTMVMPPGSGAAGMPPSEMRVIDGEAYVRGGLLGGSSQQWVHLPVTGGMLGTSPTGVGTDPSQTLEFLRSVGEVEIIGTETVREVATTHYRTTTPLGPLAQEQFEHLAGAATDESHEWLDSLDDVEVGIEAWVAADGLVRRMRSQMELPGLPMGNGASTAALTLEVLLELYDFGVEVAVAAPPDDEVVALADLETGATGSGTSGTRTSTSDEVLVLLPRFPGASVMEVSESSDDAGTAATITFEIAREGADVTSVASYYSASLPSSGWTVAVADSGDPAATAFAIAGHGFTGTLTVAPLRPVGAVVRVSVEATSPD